MANYNLSKEFIENVRSASDTVRVIGQYVKLRKRGKNYVGLCPFHDEKTPSFNVSRDRQMYYCFGCGAGGDIFNFLMRHENMDFAEAVADLAKAANLKIPRASRRQRATDSLVATIVQANEAALKWFRERLASPSGTAVRDYLAGRGIDDAAVEKFEIGYAPGSRDNLLRHLEGKFDLSTLEKAGLIQHSEVGPEKYDRFRNRIIIPIRSAGGRLIAFGGRVFGAGEPKFLNSPETPAFRKGRNLFGLHTGARAIRKRNFAVLVEGYFDTIVLHQAGFENTVAPLGTSLTEEQAKLMRRYAEKVIICLDADEAGQRATVRSAGMLLEEDLAVNIAPLPPGEDPDSYVRKEGSEQFRELLKASQPAYGHVLSATAESHDLGRPMGKRDALRELLPLLDQVRDPIERSHAVSETSRVLGIDEHVVAAELGRVRGGPTKAASDESAPDLSWLPVAERYLLIAADRDPIVARKAVDEMEVMTELTSFTQRLLGAIFDMEEAGEKISLPSLAELAENEEEKKAIAALAVEAGQDKPASALECASAVAIAALNRRIGSLSARIAELEGGAQETFDSLHAEKIELKRKVISMERGARRPSPPSRAVN